jgi:hypothetical protein
MQAPNRNRRSDRGGSVTPKRQMAALFTLPLVRQRNPRLLTHAIVAVGLAVAAADYELRCGDLRAESRLSRAGTGEVGDEALSGLSLTEQAPGLHSCGCKTKPSHVLPTPTAPAPVGIEINNASAGANEIAILLFTVASLVAFVIIKNNQRLISGFCPNKEGCAASANYLDTRDDESTM